MNLDFHRPFDFLSAQRHIRDTSEPCRLIIRWMTGKRIRPAFTNIGLSVKARRLPQPGGGHFRTRLEHNVVVDHSRGQTSATARKLLLKE